MGYYDNSNYGPVNVATADAEDRAGFIRRTYLHLGLAVLAFVVLEYFFLQSPMMKNMMIDVLSSGRLGMLAIFGGFVVVGMLARGIAHNTESAPLQYLALAGYVVAEAIIFIPIMLVANMYAPGAITHAGIITLALFAGLTFTGLTSRTDFSFLGGILKIGGFVALGLIIGSIMFGFTLGLVFSGAMIILAAGAILYDTHNIMNHYRTDQHVAASLELFASVAMMFYYVLRMLISLNRR